MKLRGHNSIKFILFIFLCVDPLHAEFGLPSHAPVDRLIATVKAFLKENPNNAHAYYTLARIHYLAFVDKSEMIPSRVDTALPDVPPEWMINQMRSSFSQNIQRAQELVLKEMGYKSQRDVPEKVRVEFWNRAYGKAETMKVHEWNLKTINLGLLLKHAEESVLNFKKALELDPGNGLYHLSLASFYKQYIQFRTDTGIKQAPLALREISLEMAQKEYYTAYQSTIDKDLKRQHRPIEGLSNLISYEAGSEYMSLSAKENKISEEEKHKIKSIEERLAKLQQLPAGPITPIIFTLRAHSSISELLMPDSSVSFDLDGDGRIEKWPWVKPTTGLLVWDPERKGEIASGRQLFGSVSWWILFENGYCALDALDDDRNGYLTKSELNGISVWYDLNSDGRSEQGEVVPIQDTPIKALGTRPTGEELGSPMHESGLVQSNGEIFSTYDWITSPSKNDPIEKISLLTPKHAGQR